VLARYHVETNRAVTYVHGFGPQLRHALIEPTAAAGGYVFSPVLDLRESVISMNAFGTSETVTLSTAMGDKNISDKKKSYTLAPASSLLLLDIAFTLAVSIATASNSSSTGRRFLVFT